MYLWWLRWLDRKAPVSVVWDNIEKDPSEAAAENLERISITKVDERKMEYLVEVTKRAEVTN